ncbi:hypothetical protein MRX96_056787 [Rhipicephalus microplus]
MNFYFFVQIALLRLDSVVGPAELFLSRGNIAAPAPDSPVHEEPSWKAAPQVPLSYHVVNRVTSADTLELQHKTRSHLQQSFSGLGSTVFGRLLMNFYFFVQIALLRLDSVVGPAELFLSRGNIAAPAPDSPVHEEPSWKAAPQVPLSYHVVNRVTSADTLELQHKTRSHLQQSFSGLGSTVFGRLLMNFYFFVQIALLRVDSVVGPAELFLSRGNIAAPAPDSPVHEEPSWKAAPQVPLSYHVVNRETSADTLELQHKTRSHLQQSFSGLGSTVFGWLLMNFYFFVQIALLRVESVVGPAELFLSRGNIAAPAPDSPVHEEPSWKAAPQVPLSYHVVNRVTSADTLELQHKTWSHLQQSFSGLGSTVFGRLLMNFYFFVQIALLRVDSVVGPAELFLSRGNIAAPAPDSPVHEEPSWKAAPQVPLSYHVVNRVTSADTLELQHKTRSHLQQSFSGLGSTVFGRLLMNFYFFVQIALLRVDSVVGPAELFLSRGNIAAPAPDSPVQEEPTWKAAPQVPLSYHVVNRVTSADTLELQHKTRSHLQQSFSGLSSTVFRRLLMNFYFFVQVAEHSYAVLDTPKTLKRKLDACTDSATAVKRKLKLSLERERRLRRKVSSYNEIIDDLKHKQLISEDASAMLERDASGASVSWDYIVQLQELQEKEGLHAATKLRAAHIQWQKQKMKVNLAVQTLSTSVADAIDFCREDLQLPQFKNSERTVKFIRIFDKLFDFLNSRNPVANCFKAPLRPSNKKTWMNFFEEVKEYIRGLTDGSGVPIFRTPRRTPFLGFLVTIESVIGLASAILLSDNAPLRYFLTYKLSQDHIELFFAAVCSKGGWNNNPTVSQFVAAYKRLVTHNQVKGGRGN